MSIMRTSLGPMSKLTRGNERVTISHHDDKSRRAPGHSAVNSMSDSGCGACPAIYRSGCHRTRCSFAMTPSGINKGHMSEKDLITIKDLRPRGLCSRCQNEPQECRPILGNDGPSGGLPGASRRGRRVSRPSDLFHADFKIVRRSEQGAHA